MPRGLFGVLWGEGGAEGGAVDVAFVLVCVHADQAGCLKEGG